MSILDMIPGVSTLRSIGIAIALSAIVGFTAKLIYHHQGIVEGRAEVRVVLEAERAAANAAADKASNEYRLLSQANTDLVLRSELKDAQRKAENDKALASVRAVAGDDVRRLRNALAAATAGSGAAPSDPGPADSGDCAATGGRLLGEVLQLAGELAGDAEDAARSYRTLLAAWPHN
jgi:hypothetical protein